MNDIKEYRKVKLSYEQEAIIIRWLAVACFICMLAIISIGIYRIMEG